MPVKTLLLAMICLQLNTQAMANEPLRFVANTAWGMPFARFEGERLTGGVMFDLGMALGAATGRPVSFVSLPRKRIEGAVLAGDVDIRCYTNPTWIDAPEAYRWTEPLFELRDVIVGGVGGVSAKPLRQVSDAAQGSILSAVLGYRYPSLDAHFDSGLFKREDTVDQEKVLLKVGAGRTPYGVSNQAALDWYRLTTPRHGLADWTLTVATSAIHCAIPKTNPWSQGTLIEALNSLKRNGKIDAILRSYK
ncbi:MAG: hypothetical protein IPG34_05900 [Rhodocyclaceae bacterium]|nr:hypothetical protein [Rhodocyclaceae bacterium]